MRAFRSNANVLLCLEQKWGRFCVTGFVQFRFVRLYSTCVKMYSYLNREKKGWHLEIQSMFQMSKWTHQSLHASASFHQAVAKFLTALLRWLNQHAVLAKGLDPLGKKMECCWEIFFSFVTWRTYWYIFTHSECEPSVDRVEKEI